MEKKFRTDRVTPAEAAKYNKIREGAMKDFPPANPSVFSAKDISALTMPFISYSLPARVEMRGKTFKTLPKNIYIQNQLFELSKENTQDKEHDGSTDKLKDHITGYGAAYYKRVDK